MNCAVSKWSEQTLTMSFSQKIEYLDESNVNVEYPKTCERP